MVIQNKKIAIIGGGPGGLTLARLLQLKGADVKVYERDLNREARIQGGALDLHTDSGLAALQKAGLMEEFKLNYRPGAELTRVTDYNAIIMADQHSELIDANTTQSSEKPVSPIDSFGDKHHRPEIDRGPLRDILLNSLLPNTVIWNSHITSISPNGQQWEISFQSGEKMYADLVIGADGANSKIRPFLTDIKPYWTGITMLEGSIQDAQKTAPTIHALLKGGKIFAFGKEQTLIVSSKGNGSFGFSVSFKSDEHWVQDSGIDFNDHTQVLQWFKTDFKDWDQVWWELFSQESTIFIPRPQYCMPLDQQWESKSNLTLLGDAAHWMPPFAGEGVNMAMLDALQLSEALTRDKFIDSATAIAHYERQMLKRFSKVGRETLFNTNWMHQPNALKNMLAMFSDQKWKQGLFMFRYMIHVTLVPAWRKLIGLSPKKEVFR